ncbi:MAG TPA: DUF4105 domain-containing protein [Polyangiaceae bacterium]|nr:DUF4105 domain-containing protein [Polyangiaceae bacterium]
MPRDDLDRFIARGTKGPRRWPRGAAVLAALLAVLSASPTAAALETPSRVSVLTMGPGEHPFTRFGHNAILLEWDAAGQKPNAVYNYGTFEFDGVKGVSEFLAGRFRYWLSVSTLERTQRVYAADERSLVAQELALSADERRALAEALAENALPERRYYDYDYYRDNCSTRVRDALDRVLDGQLRQSVVGPGRLTFRQHTLRLVEGSTWLYTGLDIALGLPTDRPTTRWDELFLPQELHDALASSERRLDGARVPLVKSERRLLESSRSLPPRLPPERRPGFAAAGIVLGGALWLLGRGAAKHRKLELVLGATMLLLGTGLGLLGCVLAGFWLFSKHWAAHQNLNLLLCPPWALGLAWLGGAVALGRSGAGRQLRYLLLLLLTTSAAALLIALVLGSPNEGTRLSLLILPIWLGSFLGLEARFRQ